MDRAFRNVEKFLMFELKRSRRIQPDGTKNFRDGAGQPKIAVQIVPRNALKRLAGFIQSSVL